jgi:RHS repeat-associated protein
VVKVLEPNLHGDLAVMANTSAAVTGTEAYSPWGQKVSTTGDALTSMFSFQSDPTDPDTGLVDMGARNYDPAQGRFETRDSIFGDPRSPMSLNQFVYGEDNPVSLSDPDGMCSDPWTCPPPPGANKAVQNTWHKLQGKASTTIAHTYTWSTSQYYTAYHGAGPGVKIMMDIAAPPAPPIPIVRVQKPAKSGVAAGPIRLGALRRPGTSWPSTRSG